MGLKFLENWGGRAVYSCEKCGNYLSNGSEVLSTNFTGVTGQAYLFRRVANLRLGEIDVREMITGKHHVRDAFCVCCEAKLGWMYEFAWNDSERYKEGAITLERKLISKSDGLKDDPQKPFNSGNPDNIRRPENSEVAEEDLEEDDVEQPNFVRYFLPPAENQLEDGQMNAQLEPARHEAMLDNIRRAAEMEIRNVIDLWGLEEENQQAILLPGEYNRRAQRMRVRRLRPRNNALPQAPQPPARGQPLDLVAERDDHDYMPPMEPVYPPPVPIVEARLRAAGYNPRRRGPAIVLEDDVLPPELERQEPGEGFARLLFRRPRRSGDE
ncbi:unnamed protein product [Caenorhabditis auriculariae]|uniref:Yippee domain-containing protein n=1 Tax=Caenorhabditis auriculariae TaxID=2777116 RepID=A0A8S1H5P7_9PELO|nr:unnamed protein product [Caenorhabditis auriculariae]